MIRASSFFSCCWAASPIEVTKEGQAEDAAGAMAPKEKEGQEVEAPGAAGVLAKEGQA